MPKRKAPTATPAARESADFADLRDQANDLPVGAIEEPDMPVRTFLEEGLGFVQAGRDHAAELAKVGMAADTIDNLERRYAFLRGVETLWHGEVAPRRSEATERLIATGYGQRDYALAAGDLAFRKSNDGQARLNKIREGDGVADLMADLYDLAALYSDGAELFQAIRVDAPTRAKEALSTAKLIEKAVAKEAAQKSSITLKELRDRAYTLCLEQLREVRAFAAFAFLRDRGNSRRAAFFSAWHRRKNRKSRAKAPVAG